MPNAIGSPEFSSAAGIGKSTSGLEAQLGRYQQELSNCVNCDTANTREGRETIQALSSKISTLKARIDEAANTTPSNHPATPSTKTSADAITKTETPAASSLGNGTVGSRVDVFA